MKYLFTFIFSFLSSSVEAAAIQQAMPPEFGCKLGTDCYAVCEIQPEADLSNFLCIYFYSFLRGLFHSLLYTIEEF